MSELEALFLRFRGSSLEFKIDPNGLQDSIRKDFEEDRTTRGEKKDNNNDKKRQYELSKCCDRV